LLIFKIEKLIHIILNPDGTVTLIVAVVGLMVINYASKLIKYPSAL
jgi:hypothetical protein